MALGLCFWLMCLPDAHCQSTEHPFLRFIDRIAAAAKNKAELIREAAMQRYVAALRTGSCEIRRKEILSKLPDAIRFAEYAHDIYINGHDRQMAKSGTRVLDLGKGRRAYRDPVGERYAEVRSEPGVNETVIVFRGTRPLVETDLFTDLVQHIGLESGYYEWAAALVARVAGEEPGEKIVVVGQSLGGGLALYAVLRTPAVSAFVFNPAGIASSVWMQASPADRRRTNASVTVFSTRNSTQIDPVTALSLSGASMIPGHIFVVESDATDPEKLHSSEGMLLALQDLEVTSARGAACEGDIGVLAE